MCGIAGWFDKEHNLSSHTEIIDEMIHTLAPRGPDARGKFISEHIVFGHSRLAVVDIEGGKQPMTRQLGEKSFTIIYNGELYNTEELRRELLTKGYAFQGHSDTEVLLLSYMEWGPQCVDKLNGIFAFAVWDSAGQSLFLARDRIGVKPLFYYEKDSFLIFASEIKALLKHPFIPAEVDVEGLAEIFMIAPARTPGYGVIRGVSELKPGHCLLINRERTLKWAYWQLTGAPHEDSLEITVEKVRSLVVDAITRQLVSDVPLGTLLSGGLDSSIITAIAANAYRKKGRTLDTFSIDYVDNDKYFKANDYQPNPDAPWVKKMSESFGTNHRYFYLDTPQLIDALDDALRARDLPGMADIDSSLLLFSRKIKGSVTVGLSGECADEIFGGYPWFHRNELQNADTFPWAANLAPRLEVLSPELKEKINPLEYLQERYHQALKEIPVDPPGTSQEETLQEATYRRISYLTLTRFMPTLLDRKDRMTMAAGLEVRVPFCDHRIVEYVWNIPWGIKNYGNREKGLLRLAMQDLLPEEILRRRKSPYPKTHNPQFVNAVTAKLNTILTDPASPLTDLIDKPKVRKMMKAHSSGVNRPWFGQLMDTPRMVAFLIQIDLWLREYKIKLV